MSCCKNNTSNCNQNNGSLFNSAFVILILYILLAIIIGGVLFY